MKAEEAFPVHMAQPYLFTYGREDVSSVPGTTVSPVLAAEEAVPWQRKNRHGASHGRMYNTIMASPYAYMMAAGCVNTVPEWNWRVMSVRRRCGYAITSS